MPIRFERPQAPWKYVAKQTLQVVGVIAANAVPIYYISKNVEDPAKDVKKVIAEHSIDDICTNFQQALVFLQRATEQLRKVSPEKANEMAKSINAITTIVMDAAVEFDLLDNPQVSRSGSTEPPSSIPAALDPSRPVYKPVFPPGLGYDTTETLAYAAQGYTIVGRGFGYNPPLVPAESPRRFKSNPTAVASQTPSHPLVDPPDLTTFPSRPYARNAATPQVSRFSSLTAPSNFPPLRVQSSGELKAMDTAKGGPTNVGYDILVGFPVPTEPRQLVGDLPAVQRSDTAHSREGLNPEGQKVQITWAKVAATPAPRAKEEEPEAACGSTNNVRATNIIGPTNPNMDEPLAEQQRVVWIRGCSRTTTLEFISEQIHEGPLMSILFDADPRNPDDQDDRAACVIFHQALHASKFVKDSQDMMERLGCCRYGIGYSIEPGFPWPADDEIRAMDPGHRQRRRLTFVGQALFLRVRRSKFEADVKSVAGKRNVELIWLYNVGNATVVLASVKVARTVRSTFMAKAEGSGPYKGAVITFSADPCEQDLVLHTQMRD
ncbi:MAG: hypothetical protein M1830_000259 [Pleopsidium flavum]|nr:MAG: hypothetical protein M1830_000259 [Pleopsidium flavum]